jgi:hypothetical protein
MRSWQKLGYVKGVYSFPAEKQCKETVKTNDRQAAIFRNF